MMRGLAAVHVLAAVAAVAAAGDVAAQVYCGHRLTQTLGALCTANYLVKRAEQSPYGLELFGLEVDEMELDGLELAWLDDPDGWGVEGYSEMLAGRDKRPVVAACCDKPCTLEELLAYC